MAFDKSHYRNIKKFVDHQIRNIPVFASHVDAVDWVIGYAEMIPGCIEREDYEAAKAIKDSIAGLIVEYGVHMPEEWLIKIESVHCA